MAEAVTKVGIISCSGEEIAEGTISRLAVRRVLEALRPQQAVTLCLPLFLAGDGGERRFAREHPTITVDGCNKLCAKRGTEQYSAQVATSLVVSDILGDRARHCHRSARDATNADQQAVWLVAERIAAEVDALAASAVPGNATNSPSSEGTCCACGSSSPEGKLEVNGKTVTINGLPLIFAHLEQTGATPEDTSAEIVLKTVKIYHWIKPEEEAAYRLSLLEAYQRYCRRSKAWN